MKETVLVFVYGSLLKDEVNHYMMENCSCIADDAWIFGRLYDANLEYPFLIIDDRKKVFGELYEVPIDELPVLDEFEDYQPNGVDNLYERMVVPVYSNNSTWQAFVYVCNQEDMLKNEVIEESWRSFRNNRR